ncbi:MAG TPA: penicillin acylase family protein, partial [Pirellulales bacterium]|nr:penicillin acylase family protein [Pirellulales bacterium]
MRKHLWKIALAAIVVVLAAVASVGWWGYRQLAGSLPQLDGELTAGGLSAPVTIDRDQLGIPTIRAGNRLDLAYATGFVHAQDRFFQMDLLRRSSAGELAELAGAGALELDRRNRVHRFRQVARRLLEASGDEDRALLETYAKGVNAGLASLRVKPFEYLLLGGTPAPWKAEDCALCLFSMYLALQGEDFRDETRLGLMHDLLPEPVFEFLAPLGTEWDAPIEGEAFVVAPIPGPDVFDTRQEGAIDRDLLAPSGTSPAKGPVHRGSNNWAVSGRHTADGRALVANDMHLDIRVPHIWYRASLVWADGEKMERRITGVTLPGTPAVIVGSNGHIAWGFTNSEGD